MSRLNFHSLLFVLVLMGWGQVDARPARVDQLPNGRALGCLSCHVRSSGGGPLTPFGNDIHNNYLVPHGRSGVVQWNAMLAMLDSDGDGVSNGQELGDPEGDGTIDASIQVTNPGDPNSFVQQQPVTPAVTSFVIGGVTLQEDVKNPPLPSGMQSFEIVFNRPVLNKTADGVSIDGLDFISFPSGLIELLATAPDLVMREDRMQMMGTVQLPEGATYQVLIGPSEVDPIDEQQQYFLGTAPLSDAVVSGRGLLPEGFMLTDDPGSVGLIDSELYAKAMTGGDEVMYLDTIVRITNFGMGEQLAFELKHVPDGSYLLSLDQQAVDAQGDTVAVNAFIGLDNTTGMVDASKLIQVVDGNSVTDLQIALQTHMQEEIEFVDMRGIRVQSVDIETQSFFFQRDEQQVRVDVSQALMIGLGDRSVEEILDLFLGGDTEALVKLVFPIAELMAGDMVSFAGQVVSETEIRAAILIRQTHMPPQVANADFDGDGDVDFSDFLLFVEAFGTSEGEAKYRAEADLDGDGTIAFPDFLLFVEAFGRPSITN